MLDGSVCADYYLFVRFHVLHDSIKETAVLYNFSLRFERLAIILLSTIDRHNSDICRYHVIIHSLTDLTFAKQDQTALMLNKLMLLFLN